jgi:hypothetical protein
LIKAVRLTIPCVVGPFANTSATLRLLDSKYRLDAQAAPIRRPVRHSVSIAASSGQNDAGVFEFNFRDERYMPFEGAGAVSTWHLSLPKSFRLFDYETISDVILRISYSAIEDSQLRLDVEKLTSTLDHALFKTLKGMDLQCLMSMRRDLPDAFVRLTKGPLKHDVSFAIEERRRPWFLIGRTLLASSVRVVLRTKSRKEALAPTAEFRLNAIPVGVPPADTIPVGTFTADALRGSSPTEADEFTLFESAELLGAAVTWFGESHNIRLMGAGNVTPLVGSSAIDLEEILDVLFDVRYKVTA